MDKPDGLSAEIFDAANTADIECQRESCKDMECNGFLCLNALRAAILKAKNDALEAAATLIDEGFYKTRAKPYRNDGVPSKNDECPHGKYMYEDCEQCCSQAIRNLKHEG